MALSTRERFWKIVGEYRQLFVVLLFFNITLLVLTVLAFALGTVGTTSTETSAITVVNAVLLGASTALITYVLRRAPQ